MVLIVTLPPIGFLPIMMNCYSKYLDWSRWDDISVEVGFFLGSVWLRDPLDTLELMTHLNFYNKIRVLSTYLFRPRKLAEDCFENFVIKKYGRELYSIFFQPYTEKLFGISGKEISIQWARQKVRLANPLDKFLENTKTKFSYFYYPLQGGFGAIVDRLYKIVQDQVLFNAKVVGFQKQNQEITAVQYEHNHQEQALPVSAVISTLPLTKTAALLDHPLALQYQKVEAVYLLINRPFISDYHWIYFIDSHISINRLVEFKNMSPIGNPVDKTVLCAEVTQHHPRVEEKVIADLVGVGLIRESEVLDTKVLREEFAYPVYSLGCEDILKEVREEMEQNINLRIVGRAAEFKHREVDDIFGASLQAVENLVKEIPLVAVADTQEIPGGGIRKELLIYAIILSFNNYVDTQECLGSLMAADFPNLEILLVDNGSTDGTPEKVKKQFPQVQLIQNEMNMGVPAGFNVGFERALQAKADYILLLNNDTVIEPGMIAQLLSVAESDEKTGIVMPKVFYYGSMDQVWSSGGRYRLFPPAILMTENRKRLQDTLRLIEYAPSCGLLIHRRAFEMAGLFDPGYFFTFDDWDFSERVRAHGLHIWYVPGAQMWHKVSRTTKGPQSPLYWRTFAASAVRFYRRHGRPIWLSLSIHLGYIIIREFLLKGNWKYWGDFKAGLAEGFQKPLGKIPALKSKLYRRR